MKNILSMLFCCVISLSAMNVSAAEKFNYKFLDFRILTGDVNDVDGTGVQINGVTDVIGNNILLVGSYQYAEGNDVDVYLENMFLGAGYFMPINKQADAVFTGGLLTQWIETNFFDDSDSGIRLSAGARFRATKEVEVYGELVYVSIFDDTDVGFSVSGFFAPNKSVGLGLEISSVGDTSTTSAIARLYF